MNLLIVYVFIFIIVWIILGIKLKFEKVGYLKSMGITITIIILGFLLGIIPTHVGKSGDTAFYTYNIYKTANIYGKGEAYVDVPSDVKKVIVHNGIEVFGTCHGYRKLEIIKIANSVIEIGGISECTSLKEVNMSNNLKIIGSFAFAGCESLENIVIPEKVEKISNYAFQGCSKLVNVELPNSLKFIGTRAFAGCESLENIKIPENVEQMCSDVFSGTKISEINIPDNANINLAEYAVGKYAESYNGTFYGCLNLKNINISQENKYYTIIDGVLFNKDKTKIVCYPSGKESDNYVIPESVTELDKYTFAYCNNLKKITISKNIKTMNSCAIYECENLEIIEIENGINEINEEAIYNCYKLSDIYIPDSVTKIPITSVPLSQLDKYDEIKKKSGKLVNSNKVTIHCNLNSFAHKYAEALDYNYVINKN